MPRWIVPSPPEHVPKLQSGKPLRSARFERLRFGYAAKETKAENRGSASAVNRPVREDSSLRSMSPHQCGGGASAVMVVRLHVPSVEVRGMVVQEHPCLTLVRYELAGQ
jgi:hypothetical protein